MISGLKRPAFPNAIDNTMRSSYVACPTRFYWQWIRRLTTEDKSVDLHAGGVFAYGLEVFRKQYYGQHLSIDEAVTATMTEMASSYGDFDPGNSNKTAAAVMGALLDYLDQYPPDKDMIQPLMSNGWPCVEFTFALEIPNTKHPESGQPIMYMGRADMIGVYQDSIYIVDEKTTKQLGPSWVKQWDLRGQLMGYVWASRELAQLPVEGAFVRGISFLVRGYGHAQVILPAQNWLLDKWLEQLSRDAMRMAKDWQANEWDQAFDQACTSYGKCGISELCLTPEPERWVNHYFVRNTWNPLNKNPEAA